MKVWFFSRVLPSDLPFLFLSQELGGIPCVNAWLKKIFRHHGTGSNDDAWGEGADVWQRWLLEFAPRADECEIARTNAFYIGSPNLHEIRVYNRLAALARGEFFMLVQGDYCLPDARAGGGLWMLHALRAFRALPRLAMLSGRVGYDDVLTRETPEAERRAKSWGQAPERPLRFEIPSGRAVREAGDWARLSGGLSTPVQFVPAVDNGPLLFRRILVKQQAQDYAFLRRGLVRCLPEKRCVPVLVRAGDTFNPRVPLFVPLLMPR